MRYRHGIERQVSAATREAVAEAAARGDAAPWNVDGGGRAAAGSGAGCGAAACSCDLGGDDTAVSSEAEAMELDDGSLEPDLDDAGEVTAAGAEPESGESH